ncbi:MAG: trimethylamine methyltransferase family protein [Deltaproteobacteria bacterium]|jgi:trimethylamine--corrinoid protein Co-methyltransferase|nr:trimethylamine methyltransferase family protein [Deltaproteobacteria bacterium]
MRTEYYSGNGVTDRKSRDKWEKEGSLDTRQRAAGIAKKLLGSPESSYISDDIDKKIREKFKILL